jgi:hypothetical protein
MKTTLLFAILLSSFTMAGLSQEQQTNAPTKATEYRKVDIRKNGDGFTIMFTPRGEMTWTADGWLVCDVNSIQAIGTAPDIEGSAIILAKAVACEEGRIVTKDYGIVKMHARESSTGLIVPEILMTQQAITKVRSALESKAKDTQAGK